MCDNTGLKEIADGGTAAMAIGISPNVFGPSIGKLRINIVAFLA